ncbi:hypothetical protein Tsubulata_049887, partial [Turnera subulata]
DSISSSSLENPFAASYLVDKFGLPSEYASQVSKDLHFKSHEQPESVINLLLTHGFALPDVSNLVRRAPRVLQFSAESIVTKIEFLRSRGASSRDVADILVRNPQILECSLENHVIPAYGFIKGEIRSDRKALAVLKRRWNFLSGYADASVSINVLRHIGVPQSNIAHVLLTNPGILFMPDRVKQTVEELKVRGSDPSKKTFVSALMVKCEQGESKWREKIDAYKSWGWTEEEIFVIFMKFPRFMSNSGEKISAVMDFVVNKLGWGLSLIETYPRLPGVSLEKRIIPRDSVIQSLLSRGTIEKKSYGPRVFLLSEADFLDKYVRRYEFADELLQLYRKVRDESQLKGGSESCDEAEMPL